MSRAFSTDDTIVAIATPEGRGAIGVVRLSGPRAVDISRQLLATTDRLRPRVATLTRIHTGSVDDDVVVTYFDAPKSYTGEDVVELSTHGNPVILRQVVQTAVQLGARLARRGEFTLRAFLNGKRDLVQAEAVIDLISAVTSRQINIAFDQLQGTLTRRIADVDAQLFDLAARLEASLDFPDEGYHFVDRDSAWRAVDSVIQSVETLLSDARRGRLIREGAQVVIAGRVNAGKSSIFNFLSGSERAIVTSREGTTRDLISEVVDLEGLAITLVDTAGQRASVDEVEREGIHRASLARKSADLVLLVLDGTSDLSPEDLGLLAETSGQPRVIVTSKADLPQRVAIPAELSAVNVSCLSGVGFDALRSTIVETLTHSETSRESPAISNIRHSDLLAQSLEPLKAAKTGLIDGVPEEFVLSDLRSAKGCFEEILGVRSTEETLQYIFERFCIGK